MTSIQLPSIRLEDYHILMMSLTYIEKLSGGQVETGELRKYLESESRQV